MKKAQKLYDAQFKTSKRSPKTHVWLIWARGLEAATDYMERTLRAEYYGKAIIIEICEYQ